MSLPYEKTQYMKALTMRINQITMEMKKNLVFQGKILVILVFRRKSNLFQKNITSPNKFEIENSHLNDDSLNGDSANSKSKINFYKIPFKNNMDNGANIKVKLLLSKESSIDEVNRYNLRTSTVIISKIK